MPTYVIERKPNSTSPVKISRVCIHHPACEPGEVFEYIKTQMPQLWDALNRIGFANLKLHTIQPNNPPLLLSLELIPPPELDPTHVKAAQPTGLPHGQRGQDRPGSQRNEANFEVLPDEALDIMPDSGPYGPSHPDLTYTDMVPGPNGMQEIPRPSVEG